MAFLPLTVATTLRRRVLLLVAASATLAVAQETPPPAPVVSPPPKSVRIRFLPPPLEGTISLGIYNAEEKLLRVLHHEAEFDEFEVGNDALSTTWDGKDDAGVLAPPGKYHARGYVVAEMGIDGVGFAFNDWVTDERSLRVKKITALATENDLPFLTAQLAGDTSISLFCNANGDVAVTGEPRAQLAGCDWKDLPGLFDPVACALGKDDTRWIIDRVAPGSAETEVAQFSAGHELLRRLRIPAEDPPPVRIGASRSAETIYLLEENSAMQRVRALTLVATKSDGGQAISDWKVEFEKKIVAHKDFAVANGEPVLSGGSLPPEKITVRLMANPLEKNAKPTAELAVGMDANGSFLKTADGLPLENISETKNLTRVVLTPLGDKGGDVFQDDGAVVEHFRLSELDQMMAFDCGEIELK